MAASTPSRTRKNPSAVRSPVTKRWSYSSQSLVSNVALLASVRAIRIVSTPHTSVARRAATSFVMRSEEHTSELQSQSNLVCRLLLEKKKKKKDHKISGNITHYSMYT